MNRLSKKVCIFSFVLLLGAVLVNSSFAQQEKEETSASVASGGKEAIAQIDSLMESFNQMGLKFMGMKIKKESATRQNMQSMMSSLQKMMRDMKYLILNIDSAAQDQKMMEDEEYGKHLQEMEEVMEHMIEHLPTLMEDMQGMVNKMGEKN
jgi:predicted house-cleaning noncanonical NTP pyrophosphatase (MazG superfamily)